VVDDGVCLQSGVEETIEIEVFEAAEISAGLDTCVITGRTIKLNASGGISYEWDNTELIVGPSNVADPVVKPLVETVFTVTVTDRNGCEFSDEVTICILEDPLAFFKEVSIITPNGDGKNDALYFSGLEAFPDNSLKIFNRWGNLIFEQEGYQTFGNLFEGLRNGDKLPADTYYYILTFEGKVVKSSLTILWN
ncbi:MAG TPA: gliding motility-associated C-terminal domain-containing protein, partial [Saprospiraceae bacterium]|nr:gliding motility-associated C-terminal domain-containing protein [Saprospiraceae bacterium]